MGLASAYGTWLLAQEKPFGWVESEFHRSPEGKRAFWPFAGKIVGTMVIDIRKLFRSLGVWTPTSAENRRAGVLSSGVNY
jgi:hypothetical protein